MAALDAAGSDGITLAVWNRGYRLSLGLLAGGLALVLAISAFSYWAESTGNYPTAFWGGLALNLVEGAGGLLILLAGLMAYHHWSYLRQSRCIH